MGDLPRVKVSDGAITEGALVVSCFPSVSHVSSIVAHYLIERLELKFVGGVVDSRLPPVALIHEGTNASGSNVCGETRVQHGPM